MSPHGPVATPRRAAFATGLEAFGRQPAIITPDGQSISYAELAVRADAFGVSLGPAPRLLLIETANEVEPLVAYLGALRHGHPVLLCAADGAHAAIETTYRPDARFAKSDAGWTTTLSEPAGDVLHPDLAVLLSTSGTTGAVKLVRLSHGAVEANARSIAEYLEIDARERPITTLPIHYSYGLSVVNSHLLRGATLLLTDASVTDERFWSFFEAERATSLAGVPYTYDLFERLGLRERTLPTLRVMTQAGGRLPAETAAAYADWAAGRGVRFYVMYGQTEATARMAYMPPGLLAANPGCVGVAIPGGAFRLAAEDGSSIEAAETPGELIYSGANVMMGYALERGDLAKGPELSELATGDLAVRTASGLYRIVGRKSRFSKLYGLRIGLDEVEATLGRAGYRCAVAGDDSLVAVALLGDADPSQAVELVSSTFDLPAAAFEAEAVSDLPTLASGKVDYREILNRAKARREASAAAGPTGGGGGLSVMDIYRRAFPKAEPAGGDSFVSLGGDSLSYVALSLELERRLGVLPLDWEKLAISDLQAMAPSAPRRGGLFRIRSLETELAIRALAIIAVVISHASDLTVGGGASVLLMLAGYNLSRYQLGRLTSGGGFEVLKSFALRIMLPYYLLLAAYLFVKQEVDIPSLTLTSNFVGRYGSLIEPYWFLEALFQCMIAMVLLFLAPPVRRWASADPWRFGLGLLAAALAVRAVGLHLFDHENLLQRTPDSLFYLLALGWCVQQATTHNRKLLVSAIGLVIAGLELAGPAAVWLTYDHPANVTHALWIASAVGAILWVRRVRLPSLLHALVGAIATASFYIYLTHGVPVHLMVRWLEIQNLLLVVTVCVALGLVAYGVMQRLTAIRVHAPAGGGRPGEPDF